MATPAERSAETRRKRRQLQYEAKLRQEEREAAAKLRAEEREAKAALRARERSQIRGERAEERAKERRSARRARDVSQFKTIVTPSGGSLVTQFFVGAVTIKAVSLGVPLALYRALFTSEGPSTAEDQKRGLPNPSDLVSYLLVVALMAGTVGIIGAIDRRAGQGYMALLLALMVIADWERFFEGLGVINNPPTPPTPVPHHISPPKPKSGGGGTIRRPEVN